MQNQNIEIIGGFEYARGQVLRHIGLLHDLSDLDIKKIDELLPLVFAQVAQCWSGISNKYYCKNNTPVFDINHSNHYCQFLLIFAHALSKEGSTAMADKIFGLNKMLNACDLYHEVALPACFYIDHSIGIVVGRAKLGEFLFLSQNCTIGSNPGSSEYPSLGAYNFLMSNATVVGNVKSGDRVIFATGALAKDIDIPSDSIVFGRSPYNVIKPLKPESFKKACPFVL